MQTQQNLTNGYNATLEPQENMSSLPDEITSIIGPGLKAGTVKLVKVVIEYVTDKGEHYVITQKS